MEPTNPSVIAGVFRDQAKADRARHELKQAGFREDWIRSTLYHLNATQEALGSVELISEKSRIIVAVMAEGRDRDALGILMNNGANNTDLPPGIVLEQGALVRSRA